MKKTLKEQFSSRKLAVALVSILSIVVGQESGSQQALIGGLAVVYLIAQSFLDAREIKVAEDTVIEAVKRVKETLQETESE